MKRAFIFPGQGSQFVGMGKELAAASETARHTFQEIDDTLGQKLSQIIFEGPSDVLTLTSNTQAALMAVSMALINVMIKEAKLVLNESCSFVAGHSLGEYTALAASGAISLQDTAKLLRIRGRAMQDSVPVGEGAMAAIIGADFTLAAEIATAAAQNEVCQIANYNSAEQFVLSGNSAAIDRAILIATEAGKRAIKLNVSAPFHSALMKPAEKIMADALAEVSVISPAVPLVANFTAQIATNPEEIRDLLVKQVTGMVRWHETVLFLKNQGVTELVEIGAGKVLSGLTKRIDKELSSISIQSMADIDAYLQRA